MDYIDMLAIQEDPEDENDDATLPAALSLSPPEVSSPAPPNPTQPTLTSTPASESSISGTSTSHLSSHRRQHLWQGQVNQCLSGANVDIAAECHRRSRTGAVILETVSHLARAFASYA